MLEVEIGLSPNARPKRVAPYWHTALLLFMLLVPISAFLPIKGPLFPSFQHSDIPFFYVIQLEYQWTLFGILFLGLLAGGTRVSDLIGKKWKTPGHFFRDCGLGFAFSTLGILAAILLVLIFGASSHSKPDHLDPRTARDLLGWFPIALSAGFIEELLCRAYLQKQFHALTGSAAVALVLQAVVFSMAHGFQQPIAGMISRFLFGLLFGMLALWRKSLLPGILGHAWQDCLVGVLSL